MVCAVQELHAATIAHRDIRRENFCFNPNTGTAVLIDLDRSCDKKEAANRANHDGASTKYSTPDPNPRPWTADMKDWRQVGIMCHFILVDGAGDYNKLEVTLASQQYFVTLFTKGRTFVGCYLALSHQVLYVLCAGYHDQALAEEWKRSRRAARLT